MLRRNEEPESAGLRGKLFQMRRVGDEKEGTGGKYPR